MVHVSWDCQLLEKKKSHLISLPTELHDFSTLVKYFSNAERTAQFSNSKQKKRNPVSRKYNSKIKREENSCACCTKTKVSMPLVQKNLLGSRSKHSA